MAIEDAAVLATSAKIASAEFEQAFVWLEDIQVSTCARACSHTAIS